MLPKASPTTYRVQQRFRGEVPALVAISMPFVKPGAGSPALLGWRDAQTLFHEFGHALHTLTGDVTRPSLGGGGVVSGSAVFPSKLFEHRLATPEGLSRLAVHHATVQPMPQALVARIQQAATFNQGFYTVDLLTFQEAGGAYDAKVAALMRERGFAPVH
nr:M3 family metallopeptidase [Corallococcus coralloides]